MATITVRSLDEDVLRRLKVRAAASGRSMEAEVREILVSAVARPSLGQAMLELGREFGGIELQLPKRTMPREISFD
ncbi:MAG: toxin-antitoxin system [Salinibacterium sp.]|nr:toxin-antitoxin system [Salinibacterium sp.]